MFGVELEVRCRKVAGFGLRALHRKNQTLLLPLLLYLLDPLLRGASAVVLMTRHKAPLRTNSLVWCGVVYFNGSERGAGGMREKSGPHTRLSCLCPSWSHLEGLACIARLVGSIEHAIT